LLSRTKLPSKYGIVRRWSSLAVKVLKTGAVKQPYSTARRKCENGCGHPSTVFDRNCGKYLCWFHFLMEHPNVREPNKKGDEITYVYYGP
jgi:hypothetical protein